MCTSPTPRHCIAWCMVVFTPLELERWQEKADGCQDPENRTCRSRSPNDSRQMSHLQNQKDLRSQMEGGNPAASKGQEPRYPRPPQGHSGGQSLRLLLPACCHCSQLQALRRKGSFETGVWGAASCPDTDLSPCLPQDIFQGRDVGYHKMGGL